VQIVALAPPLDRDREQRMRAEHRDRGGHQGMLAAHRCPQTPRATE